jgi:hypothetical protein
MSECRIDHLHVAWKTSQKRGNTFRLARDVLQARCFCSPVTLCLEGPVSMPELYEIKFMCERAERLLRSLAETWNSIEAAGEQMSLAGQHEELWGMTGSCVRKRSAAPCSHL